MLARMAEKFGTTPSRLLASSLGDWSIDLECYIADAEATKVEQAKAKAEAEAEAARARRKKK